MSVFFLALKGVAVGAVNVMPGISGATLAVIFRIYDRLIAAINGLTTDWRKSLRFLVPFGLGMAAGIIIGGSLISILIERFSFQSAGFIAGLMAGSLPFLYTQARSGGVEKRRTITREKPRRFSAEEDNRHSISGEENSGEEKRHSVTREETQRSITTGEIVSQMWKYYLAAVLAIAVIVIPTLLVGTPEVYFEGTLGVGSMVLLFLGGMAGAAAMIIPGISGAMVLVLLGIYPIAMDAINQIRIYLSDPTAFELLLPILRVVLPVGLGVIPGILLAGRGIAWLLKKYFALTYFVIIGLVLGTVFALFYNPDTYQSGDVTVTVTLAAGVSFIIGLGAALGLSRRQKE